MSHSQVFAVLALVQALLYVGGAGFGMAILAACTALVMVLAAISERRLTQ